MTLYRFETIDSDLSIDAKHSLRAISSRAEITRNLFSVWYDYSDLKANPAKVMLDFFDIGFRYSEWGSPSIYMRVPVGVIPEVFLSSDMKWLDSMSKNDSYQLLEFYLDSDESGDYYSYDDDEIDGIMASIKELRDQILKGDYRLFYLLWLDEYQEGNLGKLPLIAYDFEKLNAPLESIIDIFKLSYIPIKALQLLLQNEESHPSSITLKTQSDVKSWLNSLSEFDKNKILTQLFEKGSLTKYEALNLIEPIAKRNDTPKFEKWLMLDMLEPYLNEAAENIEKAHQAEELARQIEEMKAHIEYLNQLYANRAKLWLDMDFEASKGSGAGYKKAAEIYKKLKEAYKHCDKLEVFKQKQDDFMAKHGSRKMLIKRIEEVFSLLE